MNGNQIKFYFAENGRVPSHSGSKIFFPSPNKKKRVPNRGRVFLSNTIRVCSTSAAILFQAKREKRKERKPRREHQRCRNLTDIEWIKVFPLWSYTWFYHSKILCRYLCQKTTSLTNDLKASSINIIQATKATENVKERRNFSPEREILHTPDYYPSVRARRYTSNIEALRTPFSKASLWKRLQGCLWLVGWSRRRGLGWWKRERERQVWLCFETY